MEGDESELARLATQVGEWQRQISIVASAPFRLCFRLEEPVPAEPEPAEDEYGYATDEPMTDETDGIRMAMHGKICTTPAEW